MHDVLTSTKGQAEYRHKNTEISKVRTEAVGVGMRKARIANLPPEFYEITLRMALGKFREIRDIEYRC
jgi:intein/homing endonuclease